MLCKGCSMNHSVNYLETSKMVLFYVLSVLTTELHFEIMDDIGWLHRGNKKHGFQYG